MPEPIEPVTPAPPVAPAEPSIEQPPAGESDLGDAGKKALDAMKAERNAAKAATRLAIAEADQLRADIANAGKPAEELALDAARREGSDTATKAANARIFRSDLKAAATGQLADPTDAHLYINFDDFDVDDNGEFDSGAIADAIKALLKSKPHLAAGNQPRFEGGGDGGARPPAKPKESIDEAIAAAESARNFPLAITLKQQKAAQKG